MPHWIVTTFKMVLGRAQPRDLQASPVFVLQAAALYLLVGIAEAAVVLHTEHSWVLGVVDLTYTVAATLMCLGLRHRLHRSAQTLVAMLGCGAWLTLPSLVAHVAFGGVGANGGPLPLPMIVEILLGAVLGWSILTVARILGAAMDVESRTGWTVALTFMLVDYLLLLALPAEFTR